MMDKNVDVTNILQSKIFEIKFDFDQWPSNHTDENTYIRPYNGSIFNLRHCYKQIFHEKRFDKINEENEDSHKVFKVTYKLNLLPQLGLHFTNHQC